MPQVEVHFVVIGGDGLEVHETIRTIEYNEDEDWQDKASELEQEVEYEYTSMLDVRFNIKRGDG